jgi:hypothetical protein
MNLKSSRQLLKCPFPGALRHRRQQVHFNRKLTNKQKRLFRQNSKLFVPQLRRRFSINLNTGQNIIQFRNSISSSNWVFRNPNIIPGVVKLRRFKRLYYRQHSAIRVLKTWFNGVRHFWLQKILREVTFIKGFSTWHFIIALENKLVNNKTPGNFFSMQTSFKKFAPFFHNRNFF